MMDARKKHNLSLFLSWKLWNHLLHPREDAVFERTFTQSPEHRLNIFHLFLLLLSGCVLSFIATGFLNPLGTEFPIVVVVILEIFSSIVTVIWLIAIVANITQEYQHATYDLICVTPLGKMGVNWSIVTGTLHRQDLFRWVDSARRWLSGLIILVFLSVLIPVILSTVGDDRNSSIEGWILFLDVFVFVIFTYIEYIQSALQGILIGMLMPRFIRRTGEATLWSVFLFITLQIILITIFLVGGVFILYFMAKRWQYPSVIPQLLLLFAMREILIYGLWNLLSYKLNAEPDDLNQV